MTRQQIASMNVHPVDNPQNSLITLSDLREAARSCGFTTDPYSNPIISITHHGNMGCRVFKLERILRIGVVASCRKLGIILENKATYLKIKVIKKC